jgi:hypothetical protein
MRLPTPVATHLRTLLPVLPGEQREVLRETQLHLRREAGHQDLRVTGGSVTGADPLCRGCRVYLQLDFDAACNEPFKWD